MPNSNKNVKAHYFCSLHLVDKIEEISYSDDNIERLGLLSDNNSHKLEF